MPAPLIGLAALTFAGSHPNLPNSAPPPAQSRAEICLAAAIMIVWPWAVRALVRFVT